MEKRFRNCVAFVLFASGVFSLLCSDSAVTGAATGVSQTPIPYNLILGLMLIGVSFLISGNEPQETEEETSGLEGKLGGKLAGKMNISYEALMSDRISHRAKKGLAHYGIMLLHSQPHAQKIDALYHNQASKTPNKDFHYELGKISMLLRSENTMGHENFHNFKAEYALHNIGEEGGLGPDTIAIDAPTLNRAAGYRRRGDLRYIFKEHKGKGERIGKGEILHKYKFLGIAKHTGGKAYRWA